MSDTALFTWIGYAAGTLTTVAFAPQVVHVWKTRRARDLHLGTLVCFTAGAAMWLLYGVLTRQWPVIWANGITVGLQLVLLALKLRYGRTATRERE